MQAVTYGGDNRTDGKACDEPAQHSFSVLIFEPPNCNTYSEHTYL